MKLLGMMSDDNADVCDTSIHSPLQDSRFVARTNTMLKQTAGYTQTIVNNLLNDFKLIHF